MKRANGLVVVDDQKVKKVSPLQVINSQPYKLFYLKEEPNHNTGRIKLPPTNKSLGPRATERLMLGCLCREGCSPLWQPLPPPPS